MCNWIKNEVLNHFELSLYSFLSFVLTLWFLVGQKTNHALFFFGIVSQQIGMVSMEEKMSSTYYEIEKFTGVNDFGVWRLKMQALMV